MAGKAGGASPRWRDGGFRNQHPIAPGLRDATVPRPSLGEFLCGGTRRVPDAPLPADDPRPAWLRPPASGLRATWLGHSTVLREIDGVRLLTDPVWGARASPFRLLGPRRFQPVPVRLRELPPVDAVLISHDHNDHLDHPTIRALARPVPGVLGQRGAAKGQSPHAALPHRPRHPLPPEQLHRLVR